MLWAPINCPPVDFLLAWIGQQPDTAFTDIFLSSLLKNLTSAYDILAGRTKAVIREVVLGGIDL